MTIKLYHGSIEQVFEPEIREPNRTLDYGSGFYTTTSHKQAESWIRRKLNNINPKGFVNVYEFDKSVMRELNCLVFNAPTEQWLDFVMKNRTQQGYTHNYDIVFGPVANDKVYAAFALYEGGIIDKQQLIRELKTYKLVDQYLFHTFNALKHLHFLEAKEVKP